LALAVTRPDNCGIGGRVALLIRFSNGRSAYIDGGARAPLAATQTTIGSTPGGIDVEGRGHRIVAVPGTVAGLEVAHERYGKLPWAQLVAPAETLARDGFALGSRLAQNLASASAKIAAFGPAAEIFLYNGQPYQAGGLLRQNDLAATLGRIAARGANGLYRGETAELIAAEMAKPAAYPGDDGLITLRDLRRYRAVERVPLAETYRGHRITTAPAPAAGMLVIEILNILRGFPIGAFGSSSTDALHLFGEASTIAHADAVFVVDPDFVDSPAETIISRSYANARRAEISRDEARTYEPGFDPGVEGGAPASGHTTHLSIIDRTGTAVAVTCTLGGGFGSGVVAEGTGILLNNSLRSFGPAGRIDQLVPGAIAPSAIAPTIVTKRGVPVLVAGAAGDAAIYLAVSEVISNVADFDMDLAHAVDAERFHAYQDELGPYFEVEGDRIAADVLAALQGRGHQLDVDWGEYSPVMGILNAAGVDPHTGERIATSDPRDPDGTARGQ
jgi:gamma-glutamyltranspeptidase/glutathione hydrolase